MLVPKKQLVEPHDDERLEKLHIVLLMMLKDFDSICKENNISWLGMYGSAIGALRHKGFIPWDDDIDICLPRKDHDRFCEIVQSQYADKYEIINPETHKDYPLTTTRFILKGTEFRDANLATMNCDSGIFLDLFPLDYVADNEQDFKRQAWRCWLYNKLSIARGIAHPYVAGKGFKPMLMKATAKLAYVILNLPGINKIDWASLSLAWSKRYQDTPQGRMAYLCDTNRFSCLYEVCELFPERYVPFEDMQMPIAHKAEKLLTDYYGAWETPIDASLRREHYPSVLDFGEYEPVDIEGN